MLVDLSGFTDAELDQLAGEVLTERQNREIPEQMVALNKQYMTNSPDHVHGGPWIQPTGAHDAYPKDWVATHNGKSWISTIESNVWEPGVSGWQEQTTPDNQWPVWTQPTGAHDDYDLGAQVSHVGKHWTSDVDANVWEPGVYGWTESTEGGVP